MPNGVFLEGGTTRIVSVKQTTLLGISKMDQVGVDENQNHSNETTSFNAECYINYIRETFSVWVLVFEEWYLVPSGDNDSSNRRMANICKLPFVGYHYHNLNREKHYMIEKHPDLRSTIECAQNTRKQVKTESKSEAVLRNIPELQHFMTSTRRWSSGVALLRWFAEIRHALIEARKDMDSEFEVKHIDVFANKSASIERCFLK